MNSPIVDYPLPTARVAQLARSPWVFAPLAGIVLGFPILGVGGRIAMRAIAHATNVAPGFSLSGTMTVVLLGGVSGAAGGVTYAVLARFLPDRAVLRAVTFGVVLVLLTLRGLSPATSLSLTLFLPLTLVYGMLVDHAYRRRFPGYRPKSTSRRV